MSAAADILAMGVEKQEVKKDYNPKKFIVWLFSISISMIFAALTSAFVVRRAEGNWLEFDLPVQLLWSTLAIVLSSGFMFYAQRSIKTDNMNGVKIGLILTTILGLVFSYLQYLSWTQLHLDGIYFTGPTSNPGGSFIYVIIWTHLFHIVTGVVYLLLILISSLMNILSSSNSSSLQSCAVYWHFLGLLWIYLYLFLHFFH